MSKEFRHIVRIHGTDIDGSKKIVYGLSKIRGVGVSFANAVVKAAELKPDMRVGELTDAKVEKIEEIISEPSKYNLPTRLFDRRKDVDTGRDFHLIGPDLALKIKSDIDMMRELKTWKGVRHSLGLKVRGQRTRTTGRSGRAVSVMKKDLIMRQLKETREGEGKEEEGKT